MVWSTRFAVNRILKNIDNAEETLVTQAPILYQQAADEAAEWWSRRISASGRAPGKGMENVTAKVTQPRSGGFYIRMGWLNDPPRAEDGKTTWYVYQDVGYDLYGRGSHFVPGLMIQLDARTRLTKNLKEANDQLAGRVRRAVRGN